MQKAVIQARLYRDISAKGGVISSLRDSYLQEEVTFDLNVEE